jgi:hypothetical protein
VRNVLKVLDVEKSILPERCLFFFLEMHIIRVLSFLEMHIIRVLLCVLCVCVLCVCVGGVQVR